MRTKTLLLTAALCAAGIATSMAQVYSVNAVGYVNVSIPIHASNPFTFALIANPLNGTNNALETVLPSVPEGTTVYFFRDGNFDTLSTFALGGWDAPAIVVQPGEGFFIQLPPDAPNPTTLTFVGEVPQGTLVNPIPSGFSIRSSIVPQSGRLTAELEQAPGEGDTVYRFNRVTQSYTPTSFGLGDWDNGDEGLGEGGGPLIQVAEGFWYQNVSNEAEWSRTFTVN